MSHADRSAVRVEVPDRGRDRPAWGKVGVIALLGFVIGVAWPRVAGVRLGPKAPGEGAQAAASASASAAPGRAADPGTAQPSAALTQAPASATAASPASANAAVSASAGGASEAIPTVSVNRGAVITCKTSDGESKKGKECGGSPQALDNALVPRIRKLSTCPAAAGKSGKLAAVVTVDFGGGRLSVDAGKSSNVDGAAEIAQCLKKELAGVSVSGIDHEHPRYTVVYTTTFAQSGGGAADAPKDKDASKPTASATGSGSGAATADPTPTPDVAGGGGQVVWEKALVRDVPKTGAVVASLPRGTKVEAHQMKDNWVKIKFDKGEGWVYRGAIGK